MADGMLEKYTVKDATATTGWPELDAALLAENTLSPPTLPLADVFPEPVRAWIEAAAESKGAPPDYVALAMLSCAGGVIGNARWASPWGGWREVPVINAACVGLPSSGKSPALDALTGPLMEIEKADNADWGERRRAYERDNLEADERRGKWERDAKQAAGLGNPLPDMPEAAEAPRQPERRRIVSTNPTVEKAARLSAANPRGLILIGDELAGWIASMDRYSGGKGGGDRAFWLQAYGGRPWMPDRVKDGADEVAVPHLTWGIVGGIQPDRLNTLLFAGDDDGLAARFLFTWPASRRPTRPRAGLQLGGMTEIIQRLRSLPWTPPEPVVVPFSGEAQDVLQEWRLAAAGMEQDASGLFLSWLGKLPGLAVRLALIFAYLDWAATGAGDPPAEIGTRNILRAVTFLENYAVPMARRCFGEAALPEAERDARKLLRWLRRCNPFPATLNARELRRMKDGPGIPNSERITAALGELSELGVVRREPSRDGGAGRMRADWAVHPGLSGGADGIC